MATITGLRKAMQNDLSGHSHSSQESLSDHAHGHSGHEHCSSRVALETPDTQVQVNHAHGLEHESEHRSRQTIVSMDTLGIAASSVCLVHCLAMPFVIASLPLLGLQFLEGHLAHHVLAFFVITFGLVAVLPGYLKHRNVKVLCAMLIGLACVLCATFMSGGIISESMELPLITVGNLILVATHLRNRQLCKCTH